MQETLKKLIVKILHDTANKIDAGNCELTEEEASNIMSVLSHKVLSKEQACNYMHLSRSRFDDLVRLGLIPRGHKRQGFKELIYYQDELDAAIEDIKRHS